MNGIVNEGKRVQNENQGYKMEEDGFKNNVHAGSTVLRADNFESVCTWKRYPLAMNIFRRMEGNSGAVIGNVANVDGKLWTFLGGIEVCGHCRWFLVSTCVFYEGGTWILFL